MPPTPITEYLFLCLFSTLTEIQDIDHALVTFYCQLGLIHDPLQSQSSPKVCWIFSKMNNALLSYCMQRNPARSPFTTLCYILNQHLCPLNLLQFLKSYLSWLLCFLQLEFRLQFVLLVFLLPQTEETQPPPLPYPQSSPPGPI